jgi:hypothetical protein
MNEVAQQIGAALAVVAAVVYLAMSCWRRATGLGRAGQSGGCGGCAKCPAIETAADGAPTAGKALPLVNIDLSPATDAARRPH